ncbi:MAG: hypothetical protein AAFQ82_27290 [Myxococcota bacterium]
MDAKSHGPSAPAPPRPEVTLAVLRHGEDGPTLELHLARLLDDADVFALNISRDPSGTWSAALNVSALEGTRLQSLGRRRAMVSVGPSGCDALQIQEGDSLLVGQMHRSRGRSAQSLVTVLRASRA